MNSSEGWNQESGISSLQVMDLPENVTDYINYYDPGYYNNDYYITTDESRWTKESAQDFIFIARIFALLIFTVTCLLGLLGNGLVIAVIMLKMKKSVNAIWFLNLAAADFLFNVFLPLNIAYTAMGYHWVFGKGMCKVNTFLLTLNMYTSVFLLTMISFDRCISVAFPVWSQNHRKPKIAWFLCALIWGLGFLLSSPALVFRDTTMKQDRLVCFNNYSLSNPSAGHHVGDVRHMTVTVLRFLAGFIVPMAIITVCYLIIIIRLKRNRLAKSKKPLRIIVAIIMTFFLCWCPYHVINLMETQHHLFNKVIFETGIPIATAIAVSNSCLNPVLYVFMGQDFKKFKMTVLSRLANALSEDTVHSTLTRRSFTKPSSMTEKETILV